MSTALSFQALRGATAHDSDDEDGSREPEIVVQPFTVSTPVSLGSRQLPLKLSFRIFPLFFGQSSSGAFSRGATATLPLAATSDSSTSSAAAIPKGQMHPVPADNERFESIWVISIPQVLATFLLSWSD